MATHLAYCITQIFFVIDLEIKSKISKDSKLSLEPR